MQDKGEQAILRAGVLCGFGGGLGFGCGAMMVADAVGLSGKMLTMHPVVVTFGIVPLICFVYGVQILKKAKAAN